MAIDAQLRLTEQLADGLSDRRDQEKIRHAMRDLPRKRIFSLACGPVWT